MDLIEIEEAMTDLGKIVGKTSKTPEKGFFIAKTGCFTQVT